MALTKAKVSFLEGVDGSALTGAMPAVDGSSLTGISGMTKVTSDPALNTNPSSGVGTTWVNKSSGEMFVCTDATAGENVACSTYSWVSDRRAEDATDQAIAQTRQAVFPHFGLDPDSAQ